MLAAAVLAVVAWSGAGVRPSARGSAAVGLLLLLAVWAGISLEWSPVPSLARDEALLTAFYAVALALPLVSLRTPGGRLAALGLVTAVLAVFTVAASFEIGFAANATRLFDQGRLYFPITYANAQGSLFALGMWPALLLASRRAGAVASRALWLGTGVAFLSAATLAQSKGTTLGLAVSAVVVLALSPARLRLLVLLLVAAGIEAAAFRPLTEPYRHETLHTIHTAGLTVLVAGLCGVVVGIAYVVLDRRLSISPARRRQAGRAVAALTAATLTAGAVAFVAAEHHPIRFVDAKWASFKHFDPNAGGATHLTALGSNRYDFWRVSLIEFERHPVNGCGARCFGPAYLVLGRSSETPARAHSLPLEVLAEQGIVGFVLLGGSLGLLALLLAKATRRSTLTATAGLGAFACWLVQACVDWTWTFPAVTVPALLIAGVGAAGAAPRPLARPLHGSVAPVAAAIAVLAFLPPWYAQRLVDRALQGRSRDAANSLSLARRLDPISTAPLVAQAVLASSSTEQLRYLREAARREPRVLQTQYFLGSVLLNSGRKAEARRVFEHAAELDPGNEAVARALRLSR